MSDGKPITEHPTYEKVEAFTVERAESFCWMNQTMSSFMFIKLIHELRVERDLARASRTVLKAARKQLVSETEVSFAAGDSAKRTLFRLRTKSLDLP